MRYILIFVVWLLSFFSTQANLSIQGEFNGWHDETIVKLSNNTFWIQNGYYYQYCYFYNPQVELYQEYGQIKMFVNGCENNGVSVKQLRNVIETSIDGQFEGFDGDTIFKMRNGTLWKQKRYKYWYRYAYNPKCLLYENNGWKLFVLGQTVDVERIR